MRRAYVLLAIFLILLAVWPTEKVVVEGVTASGPKAVITVSPSPHEVNPGETVVVDVTVNVIETINSSSVLVVYINNEKTSELSLAPLTNGSVVSYQFNFTPTEPGYYVIRVELNEKLYGGAS